MSVFDNSLEHSHVQTGCRGGFADVFPHDELAEAFPECEPTAEELEAEYQRCVAGVRPADWYDVPCERCQAAITVMPGTRHVCRQCQRSHARKVAAVLSSATLAGIVADPASTVVDADPDIVREVYAAELMRRPVVAA